MTCSRTCEWNPWSGTIGQSPRSCPRAAITHSHSPSTAQTTDNSRNELISCHSWQLTSIFTSHHSVWNIHAALCRYHLTGQCFGPINIYHSLLNCVCDIAVLCCAVLRSQSSLAVPSGETSLRPTVVYTVHVQTRFL